MKKAYTLIALDVDGTLVEGEHGVVSRRVREAIARAAERMHVVLCTGRDEAECQPIVDALGIHDHHRILGGGSTIQFADGSFERSGVLDSDLVCEAVQRVGETGFPKYLLTEKGWQLYRGDSEGYMLSFHTGSHRQAAQVEARLGDLHDKLFVTKVTDSQNQNHINVHLGVKGVSKGRALQRLASRINLSTKDFIAVGDMPIDIPMFEVVGLAVAMGNAPDTVKQRAHITAPSLMEDGVAEIIEKFILGDLP